MTGETRRQLEHLAPLGFALLLGRLPYGVIVALAVAAVGYGAFLSPRVNPAGVRPEELRRGYSPGKLWYALSVLALLLVFSDRLEVVAGAWAALALGDGLSNLAGRRWGARKLPWSGDKSWVGSAVFVLSSWAGSLALVLWTAEGTGAALPGMGTVLLACGTASLAAALVESLPLPLDDNLTVPLTAAMVLAALL